MQGITLIRPIESSGMVYNINTIPYIESSMLLSEYILLEDKATFIATKQHNAIIVAYQADKGHHSLPPNASAQEIVNELRKADPTGGKYLQWIVNMYVGKQFMLEDISRIHDELKEFTRVRTKLDVKDINQYKTLPQLYAALEPHADTTVKSGKQQKKELSDKLFADGEAKLFYKDDKITVIIPKTRTASCYFGQGTKWCTAGKNNNLFDDYAERGNLYIIQTSSGKYQFQFESNSFMDDKDSPVDVVKLANKYPSLKIAFNAIAIELLYLPLIKDVTPEVEMAAVKQNTDALKYIKNPTPEVVMTAVTRSGAALRYVKNPTPEVELAAVKQNGEVLRLVKNQTPEIVMAAVKKQGYALQHVKNPTPEVVMAAINQNGYALQYVEDQTPEMALAAVKQTGYELRFVKNQTPEIAMAAVKKQGLAFSDVKNPTPEITLAAVKQNGIALRYVRNQTYDIALAAVNRNKKALKYTDPKFKDQVKRELGLS